MFNKKFIFFYLACDLFHDVRWEPSARITPDEALQHEWLQSASNSSNTSPSGVNNGSTSTHHHQQHQNTIPRVSATTVALTGGGSFSGNTVASAGGGSTSSSSGDSCRSGGGVVERRRDQPNTGGAPSLGLTASNGGGSATLSRKPLLLNQDSGEEEVYTLYQVLTIQSWCFLPTYVICDILVDDHLAIYHHVSSTICWWFTTISAVWHTSKVLFLTFDCSLQDLTRRPAWLNTTVILPTCVHV